ncbi:MAG: hypothetical protein J5I50_05185 [Chitinophagaceae bacterium]|nr:hypothetical protein [Chitinophagaceae bacterium]
MKLSETYIDQARQTDIIEVIGRYIQLRRAGRQYVGLCPFHDEKTPSFFVTPGRGYYCFGCDAKGGNSIDFIMQKEKLSFPDAVIRLSGNVPDYSRFQHTKRIEIKPLQPQVVDYIPFEKIRLYLEDFKANNLFKFFVTRFGELVAEKTFKIYSIGTYSGLTLFPQTDLNGNIRQAKVIEYDPATGKRNRTKNPFHIGKQLTGSENLQKCFFGENLLKGNTLPVAIVESEKTAAISSIIYPQFVWIATGGKNGVNPANPENNRVLKNRIVHLFPDVDGVKTWKEYADDLQTQGFKVFLNDVMAEHAEPGSKDDIADLILKNEIILSENIFHVQWISEYKNLKTVWFIMDDRTNIEIIFGLDDYPLPYGEHESDVNWIEHRFNRKYEPALFDGETVYCYKF